jgi:hypothetical protein
MLFDDSDVLVAPAGEIYNNYGVRVELAFLAHKVRQSVRAFEGR